METLSDGVEDILSSLQEDSRDSFYEKLRQLSQKLSEIKEKERPTYTMPPIDTIGKKIYSLLNTTQI